MGFRLAGFFLLLGLGAADVALGAPAPPPPLHESIHRLGSDAHQLRFEGENAARTWSIYTTAAQAEARARIHLSYSNAISVMPEVSTLSISVNDVSVAQTPIAAASDPGGVDVELPRGLLTPGYNTVRVSVTQRHRVDCSLEATYELWTQLDPATSGLTFPGLADPAIASLDDLAAISPDMLGAVPIRVVLPDDADSPSIDRALYAAQAVVIRAGFVRPNVEIVNAIDDRPGLWVLVGAQDALRAHGLGKFVSEGKPLTLAAGAAPGQTILVASGPDLAQTDQAISRILPPRRSEPRASTSAVSLALAGVSGFPVAGNSRVPLHDMGVQTEEFNGRLFRAAFDVLFPPDFYPADYDKLTLLISAGYSAGLLPGSQILVRVNDKEAGSLPLGNPKGDVYKDRPVSVSLAALRPGVNHVVIEAQTPTADDAACDVRNLMDAKKRFVLFDRSELIVPSIARIAQMPNLAVTMTSGFPYLGANAGRLYLAKHDRATIGSAATFLARAAFVSRRPSNLRVTFDGADLQFSSAILFGSIGDFSPRLFERFGVDYQALRDTWARPDLQEPAPTEGAPGQVVDVGSGDGSDLYDQWADGVHDTHETFNARASLRAIYDRYFNVHRSDFALLRDPAGPISPPNKSTLLLAQTRGPAGGRDTWTLVVGANAADLARDVRGLVAPSNWNMVEGRAAAFDQKAGAINLPDSPDTYFIETAALTPGNLRLVAAGWLSSNIDYYIFAMAVGAAILGVLTFLTARAHGAQQ